MANIGAGSSVSASGFNGLFNRLESLRANHKTAMDNADTGQSALNSSFSYRVSAGNKPVPSDVQAIKNYLANLASSSYVAYTFSNNISVPSSGSLMTASTFNVCDNNISAVEGICANYSKYYQYSNYYNWGNYSNYATYGY